MMYEMRSFNLGGVIVVWNIPLLKLLQVQFTISVCVPAWREMVHIYMYIEMHKMFYLEAKFSFSRGSHSGSSPLAFRSVGQTLSVQQRNPRQCFGMLDLKRNLSPLLPHM